MRTPLLPSIAAVAISLFGFLPTAAHADVLSVGNAIGNRIAKFTSEGVGSVFAIRASDSPINVAFTAPTVGQHTRFGWNH